MSVRVVRTSGKGRFAAVLLIGVCSAPLGLSVDACGQESLSADRALIVDRIAKAQRALEGRDAEAARALYMQAAATADSVRDVVALAMLHNLVGGSYEAEHAYQDALQHFERGLDLIGVDGLADRALTLLQSWGKSYVAGEGDPVSADLYPGSIDDAAAILHLPDARAREELAVRLTINAANMYLRQRQFRLADSLYVQSAERGSAPWRRKALTNLSWSLIAGNHLDRAGALLDSVVSDASEPDSILSRAVLALGVLYRTRGEYNAAIRTLKRAAALYEDDGGRALAHLGTAQMMSGDYESAVDSYRQALRANESAQDLETGWHVHAGLAQAYQELGDYDAALTHYDTYLQIIDRVGGNFATDQGRISFLESQSRFFEGYARAALHVAGETGDYETAERIIDRLRGETLSSLRESRRSAPLRTPGHLPAGYALFGEEWSALRDLYEPDASPMAQVAPGVQTAPASAPRSVDGFDPSLIPPATFLKYFVMADRVAIFVRDPDGRLRGHVVTVDVDTLEQMVASYGQALELGALRGFTLRNVGTASADSSGDGTEIEFSRAIYRLLVQPVADWLPTDSDALVVLVPHRSLWLLPFAALRSGESAFFGDRHLLVYADSRAGWRHMAGQPRRSDHTQLRAWIAGNPRLPEAVRRCGFEFSFHPLPGAQREAEELHELLGPSRSELFVGRDADRLRLEAWHPAYSVVHLATHGFACVDDPLSSFLVLSDIRSGEAVLDTTAQLLTVRRDARLPVMLDGLDMVMRHPHLPPPDAAEYPGLLDAHAIINGFQTPADLVTLSACQSGLGRVLGQGTIGFTRAFLAAGARSVVVSLWRVDDAATTELMISFYRSYLDHGNKARALRQAMSETRSRYPDPRYWAAFTLVGLAE